VDIRDLDKDERRRLYNWVLYKAHLIAQPADAKDLTQRAFMALQTNRSWSEDRGTTLKSHLRGLLKSLRSHGADKDELRRGYEQEAAREAAAIAEDGRSPESYILERATRIEHADAAKRRVEALRAILTKLGLTLDLEICELFAEGVERVDLEERTGRSAAEVKTALARIRRHMAGIFAAERGKTEDSEVSREVRA
jgi:DNA-directed RNA polymerase specialized sigma24 family protein